MAKFETQLGYGCSGTIGPVVESSWNGIRYLRSRPAHYHDRKSIAQQAQRNKMTLCLPIVCKMKELVKIGYGAQAIGQSAYNACMSRNMRCAVLGEFPEQRLSYEHILLGEGPLAVAKGIKAELKAHSLHIAWEHTLPDGNSSPFDKTLIGLYNPKRNSAVLLLRQNERRDGSITVTLPTEWQEEMVQCYFGFQNSAEKLCSNVVHVAITEGSEL